MISVMQAPLGMRMLMLILLVVITVVACASIVWIFNYRRSTWRYFILAIIVTLSYICTATIRSVGHYNTGKNLKIGPFENWMEMPVVVMWILILCMMVGLVWLILQNIEYSKNHISQNSVEESFDNLPAGICCYYSSGYPRLLNSKMKEISFLAMGKVVDNWENFWNDISKGEASVLCDVVQMGEVPILQLSDGRVYSFRREPIPFEKYILFEIMAVDITEEFEKNKMLEADQVKMTILNRRLKEYSQKVTQVTIEKEILAAKVRIHDELGHALIATKRYLGTKAGDQKALVELWENNIALLKAERYESVSDDYDTINYIANCAGIQIKVEGKLPQNGYLQHIIVTALSECITNTSRHAKGNEICIMVSEEDTHIQIQITNNGEPPVGEIKEGGGLSGLRKLTEMEGGQMIIKSQPAFCLVLDLPKR